MKTLNSLRLKLIDSISGLKIHGVLAEYKREQYLPAAELDRIRYRKLDELFEVARRSTRFYASYDNYDSLPILNKKIISQDAEAFSSSAYKDKRIKKATSGSTGTPFIYYTSLRGQSHLWAGLILSWESGGYEFGEKVAFVAGNALIKKSFKHRLFYKLMNIDLYPVAIMTSEIMAGYIETICQKNTSVIYGYASAVNTMAEYVLQHKIQPPASLKAIVCTSEMLTDSARATIEKAFGVKVHNQYGCNEAGISAFECDHQRMHLISSRSVYEINDDGHFIGTDLANEADILMKYDTGDMIEFANRSCSCGRQYPVIEKIIGRSADVIIDRSGKKIHTTFFTHLFQRNPSVRQFQVIYDESSVTLNMAVDKDFSQKDHNDYLQAMKDHLNFETYHITTNKEFYTGSNLKHTFIADRRKIRVASV